MTDEQIERRKCNFVVLMDRRLASSQLGRRLDLGLGVGWASEVWRGRGAQLMTAFERGGGG